MPRVRKGAARTQKRNRVLRQARGYDGMRSVSFWRARLAVIRAGVYAYRDRRARKRDMRSLWITRLTAACRMRGTRYSVFMQGMKLAGILLNRKVLSQLAIDDPKAFDVVLEKAVAAAKAAAPKAPVAAKPAAAKA